MKYYLNLFFTLYLLMNCSTGHAGRVDHQYLDNMSAEGWVLNIDQVSELFKSKNHKPIQHTEKELADKQHLYVIKIQNKGNKTVKGKLRWALIVEDGVEWLPAHVTFELTPYSLDGAYYVVPSNLIILGKSNKTPVFKFEWISLNT